MKEMRLLLLLFWWLFGYLYALDFYNWTLAIVVGLAWQKLAGKEIPANANDPRWRRRDALHLGDGRFYVPNLTINVHKTFSSSFRTLTYIYSIILLHIEKRTFLIDFNKITLSIYTFVN